MNGNLGLQLTYNEPIADRTYLQFSYRYNYSYNKNDRQAFVYDSDAYRDLSQSIQANRYDIDAVLKFMEEANYMLHDTLELSQFSEYRNYNQTISAQFRRVRESYNFSYGGKVQWTAPWGTQAATDIRMVSRRGYSQAALNTNELLWNASISHSFLQGKALTLKAEVFDILHQQTNISRQVDAFSRRDSRNNAIYQYAMFSAILRFSVYGGKNTMGTDKEKK